MIVNISYPCAALHEAAKFIWENNPSVEKWPSAPKSVFDVISNIQSMMKRGAMDNAKIILKERALGTNLDNEWLTYTGTGGYYLVYTLRDSDDTENVTIEVDILVDPAVSDPTKGFTTEFVDEIVER